MAFVARAPVHLVLNMAMTADGKVATAGREVTTFGSRHDQRALYALRASADALLCGARTVEETGATLGTGSSVFAAARREAGLAPAALRVVVSGSASLASEAALWRQAGAPIVILTRGTAPEAQRERLRKLGAQVWCSPGEALDLRAALDWLAREHGVRRVVAEGGGVLNAALLAADLVDEVRLTWVPRIFGGATSPTIADGPVARVLEDAVRFRRVSVRSVGDERFLRYLHIPRSEPTVLHGD
ncbi:MAG: RibD family protein [Verrucomicrobiota bacterium]